MPQINVALSMDASALKPVSYIRRDGNFMYKFISYFQQTSKTLIAICAIILLTALYKLVSIVQTFIKQLRNKNDVYACEKIDLIVPTDKHFPYKITKMIVDEADSLVCSYNNGSVYVWDLHNENCSYYINRR